MSKKDWRKGRERIEMDFVTFMRLVNTSEEQRKQAAGANGLLQHRDHVREVQAQRIVRLTVTCKQLTEERQQINQAIRTLQNAVPTWFFSAQNEEMRDFMRPLRALVALLPPDAPSPEGE